MTNQEVINKRDLLNSLGNDINEKGYKNMSVNLMILENGEKLDKAYKNIMKSVDDFKSDVVKEIIEGFSKFVDAERKAGDKTALSIIAFIGEDEDKLAEWNKYIEEYDKFMASENDTDLVKLSKSNLKGFDIDISTTSKLYEFVKK